MSPHVPFNHRRKCNRKSRILLDFQKMSQHVPFYPRRKCNRKSAQERRQKTWIVRKCLRKYHTGEEVIVISDGDDETDQAYVRQGARDREIRTQVFTGSSNRSRYPVRRVNLKGTPIVKLERKRSPSANPGLKQKSNVLSHCPKTCRRRSCLLEFAVSGRCIIFYPGQERSIQPSRLISAERNIQSTIVCT
ncbi:hypothetical protein DPMN_037419 [Dreissena polymorpha]|uniref:Uncharacterized protein n=1 Tax=Dreissena polymorpha TaxID=45954 RepID=A0A9D4MAY1_DREPO|nr:hypothetical protein DPMN_037419 [Dreissena polymorpha]